MRKQEINVYKFKELKKETQEKVLRTFRENEDFIYLKDNLKDFLNELLKKRKIKLLNNLDINYSLSNSQGDGVSFFGSFEYKDLVIFSEQEGLYSHSNCKHLSYSVLYVGKNKKEVHNTEMTEKQTEKAEKILKEFNLQYYDICDILEKRGYEEIEYLTSDKVIKENIEMNEYEFTENGEIF